ncbi:Bug family tripartite tricarboxylate transporter substrate binding protein [Hydrogenophaga sp. BPS33]|uniref:Bug family tripartite tricarboxylate transporter substrate binding protein n=1 Tax=Hydrogenophaga sp. BPS33 TaxID=2651974 RepID=UPI00131F931A|nr:tripartite tricarboxylate transporter substrate binding protein [Hydrogenophaga sp. BPS33]QHE85204.1 tripartite tricarboxylate transporter substrate binding protein [Hydrogenophaga sp. BPS33]
MKSTSFNRRGALTRTAQLLAVAAFGLPILSAHAAYPDKPIRLIVPFPAGGAGDTMARTLGERLTTEVGQQIIIDNRGGAGGATAAEAAVRSAPDGYTLFFGTMGTNAINVALYPKLRYDPIKDFAPVALTHINPRVLVVGPSVKAKNVAELIALAKSKPDGLTYGSAGSGSSGHLSGALFESIAGVKMLHVPYKGSAPLMADVLAGRVDLTFDSYTVYQEHIKTGKVTALAVTSRTRMGVAPDLPTLEQAGLKEYDVSNWLGVFAPAGTPADIVKSLNTAIGRAMATPELKKQLVSLGIEPAFSTPEALGTLVKNDIPKWAEIVKRSGATVD